MNENDLENQGPGGQETYINTSQIIVVMILSALVVVMLFLLLVCCNSTWYPEHYPDNQSENKSEWNTEMRNRNRIVRTRKKQRRSNSCIAENNKEFERPIIR